MLFAVLCEKHVKLKTTLLLFGLCISFGMAAQEVPFTVTVNELDFNEPVFGVQSFISGSYGGKWLMIGGRTDGLHRRQPFASFLEEGNNTMAFVFDPSVGLAASASLEGLSAELFECLQSTNQQYVQVENTLYTTGGYGYSPTALDHTTHPYLTAIDVEGLILAIEAGEEGASLEGYFRQIEDEYFAVTGGYLGYLEGVFYLAGGQFFEGRYNPMGPDHGPGFTQEYTESIKRFTLEDDGENLAFITLDTWIDPEELHRRDYNMAPQVFPDGDVGFTMFSGVFQLTEDIPWHNTVDILSNGFTPNNAFDQLLNQYHTAHVAMYDEQGNAMHTLFFGGMSRYYFDDDGVLWDDVNVPFVTTISRTTRHGDGSMSEVKMGDMDGFLGTGAEFLLHDEVEATEHGVILLDQLPEEPVVVGYIVGGIESSQDNIFFINDGDQSEASQRVFEVLIHRGTTGSEELVVDGDSYFYPTVYPNPSEGLFQIDFRLPAEAYCQAVLIDHNGRVHETLFEGNQSSGWKSWRIDLSAYPNGGYYIRLNANGKQVSLPVIVQKK